MNTKNVILATAIATVFLIAMMGSASADTEITSLPYTADIANERYFLTGDLTCTDNSAAGITIANSGITIDGQGNKITGNENAAVCDAATETVPSVHSGIANVNGYDNVVIKNLEVENFCTGIAFKGSGPNKVTNNTVCDCLIHDNGNSTWWSEDYSVHGIHLAGAVEYSAITRNTIHSNTGGGSGCSAGANGIFIYGSGGWYNDITCNHLYNNRLAGIFLKKGAKYHNISYNNASGNLGGGIVPKCKKSDYETIEYNIVSNNAKSGISLRGSHCTIRYNTAINNGKKGIEIVSAHDDDLEIDFGTSNTVTNNTFCGNTDNDIQISQNQYGYTNTVDKNTCDDGNNASYCDDWKCNSLTQVYYDFDEDRDCSQATCSCGNTLGVGSCCNPGKFNSSGANNHCAACQCCNTAVGHDTNDCDGIPSGDPVPPVPELPTLVLLSIGLLMLAGYVVLGKRRKE